MNEPCGQSDAEHKELVHSLFVRHSGELRGFVLALLPDMSRADDILQETFLTISRKASTFKAGTNFLAWACTIARFKVLEAGRQQPSLLQPLSEEVLEALCASEPPPEPPEERLKALTHCLKQLAPHTRRAVELRYQQGHKPPEIANHLGWSTASVYVVLSRARNELRVCVDRQIIHSFPTSL